jgi:hypothetical protein
MKATRLKKDMFVVLPLSDGEPRQISGVRLMALYCRTKVVLSFVGRVGSLTFPSGADVEVVSPSAVATATESWPEGML